MPGSKLSAEEQSTLLCLARQAITEYVLWNKLVKLDMESIAPNLREEGATFVTLTINGELRGCIGTLESRKPLAEDVMEHAVAAANQDYRFPPLMMQELDEIKIEISCLTKPQHMNYVDADELITRLRPGIDGVIAQYGSRRATFLPQVWEKLPDPEEFLDNLCFKMGVSPDLWRQKKLDISTYEVDEFHE